MPMNRARAQTGCGQLRLVIAAAAALLIALALPCIDPLVSMANTMSTRVVAVVGLVAFPPVNDAA
jgi:hypothetical protein